MSHSYISVIDSPFGKISVSASHTGINAIHIDQEKEGPENEWSKKGAAQLTEYFKGEREDFDLKYDFEGYTKFQQSVWAELLKIPFGTVISYMDIAKALNNTGAIRAVGAANGANPIGIIVPCHRVIGSNGKLTGYAHGIEMKRWLLEHEGAIQPEKQLSLF